MTVSEHHISQTVKAVECIEENLRREFNISQAAEAAAMSLFHFIRTFNKIVKHSPYDYLMRRRLTEAAADLITTDKSITGTGFDYQFRNIETFSRAFKKMFGVSPANYRKERPAVYHYLPKLDEKYLSYINNSFNSPPEYMEISPTNLMGISTIVQAEDDIRNQLMTMLAEELKASDKIRTAQKLYFVFSEGESASHRMLFAGVDLVNAVKSDLLVMKTITAGKYASISCTGGTADIKAAYEYLRHTRIPKSGYRQTGNVRIEIYDAEMILETNSAEPVTVCAGPCETR